MAEYHKQSTKRVLLHEFYRLNRLVALLDGPVTYVPKRPGEPNCTWANIDKIKAELGWEPSVPFEEGVALMLADIERWRAAPLWDPASIARATETWFTYLGEGAR